MQGANKNYTLIRFKSIFKIWRYDVTSSFPLALLFNFVTGRSFRSNSLDIRAPQFRLPVIILVISIVSVNLRREAIRSSIAVALKKQPRAT